MLKKYCQIFQPRLLPLYTGLSGFYLPTVSRMHMCILSPCSILPYHKQQKHIFFKWFRHIILSFKKSRKTMFWWFADIMLRYCKQKRFFWWFHYIVLGNIGQKHRVLMISWYHITVLQAKTLFFDGFLIFYYGTISTNIIFGWLPFSKWRSLNACLCVWRICMYPSICLSVYMHMCICIYICMYVCK